MTDKDITLSNLTQRQVELLDHMWSLEDIEDVEAWQATLDPDERKMSDVLLRMILLELVEEQMVSDLSAANKVLQQFRL
jgi:hypothetical protein